MKRRMWRREGGVKIEGELVSFCQEKWSVVRVMVGEGVLSWLSWSGIKKNRKEKRRVFVDIGALVFI